MNTYHDALDLPVSKCEDSFWVPVAHIILKQNYCSYVDIVTLLGIKRVLVPYRTLIILTNTSINKNDCLTKIKLLRHGNGKIIRYSTRYKYSKIIRIPKFILPSMKNN